MAGACRLRQIWRFNLILTHCGFLGRASAKQSEISEHSEHSEGLADARTMVCRSWLTAYPPWRRWGVVWSGTACHRLPGWQLYMCSRCSGHVADTPVGEIPGYAQLPPPAGVAEMSAFCHHHRLLSSSPPAAVGMRYIASAQSNANSANTMDDKSTQPAAVGRDTYLYRYKYRKVEPARCGCNRNW